MEKISFFLQAFLFLRLSIKADGNSPTAGRSIYKPSEVNQYLNEDVFSEFESTVVPGV